MKRYGHYALNISLEDAWNRNLKFFEKHNCKVKEKHISTNKIYRKIRIRHGFSMKLYGTSSGETYDITFGYDPSDNTTYVGASVKYSNFGKGFPSQIPKEMMKKWAHKMGITKPMKLVKEMDYNFFDNLDKIQDISPDHISNLSKVFCPACGESNSKKTAFCVYCGIKIEI